VPPGSSVSLNAFHCGIAMNSMRPPCCSRRPSMCASGDMENTRSTPYAAAASKNAAVNVPRRTCV
jgi:hypothetical protein